MVKLTIHYISTYKQQYRVWFIEDVIDSYYLDSQIKDDFMCNQNCHIKTQHIQQDQTLTPCTHAYDHITQHINSLENPIQQHTVYTNEVDASLFTMDTTTPCDYNISIDTSNLNNPHENKYHQGEFIPKVNINTEMFLVILTSNIMTLIMVMHSLSQINIQYYYNKNYKTLIGANITTKSYQISSEMDIETIPHAMYFSGSKETITKISQVPYQ